MRKIAVLGWGSLIWDPGTLGVSSKWRTDGPCLPIEFARKSDGMRATLVVVPGYECFSRSYWALSVFGDVGTAADNLRIREGMDWLRPIHVAYEDTWHSAGDGRGPKDDIGTAVSEWVAHQDVDAAIWTGLAAKTFEPKSQRVPLEDQVVAFLRSLDLAKSKGAREYVEKAPASIDTPVRQAIEIELGWGRTPLDPELIEGDEPGEPCA